jgi:FeS assembly SUF system regulator
MLRIGKLTDYGTLVMVFLAEAPKRMYSAPQIALRLGLEPPTVRKVLKSLEQAALVVSRRGARGGYRLAREPDRISLGEVLAALEGPLALTECGAGEGLCAIEQRCAQRPHWRLIGRAIARTFEAITLADMACSIGEAEHPLQRISVGEPCGFEELEAAK